MSAFISSIQHHTTGIGQGNQARKTNKRHPIQKERNKTLYAVTILIYRKLLINHIKAIRDNIVRKMSGRRSIHKKNQLCFYTLAMNNLKWKQMYFYLHNSPKNKMPINKFKFKGEN